jgi:hypothetical protein
MTSSPDVEDRFSEWLREQLTHEPLRPLSGDLAQRVATHVTRRRQAMVVAAAVLVAVAALTPALLSHSTSSSTATSSSTPSGTSAAPTTWTLAQACDYWRKEAEPVDEAYDAMHAAQSRATIGATSWKTVRNFVSPYATASRTFAQQLLSPPQPWPTQLATWIPPTAAFWVSMAAWEEKVAGTTTEAEFNRLFDTDPSVYPPVSYQEAETAVAQACHAPSPTPRP